VSQDILVIAPIYQYHPILLHSLIAQQCGDWRLLLIHDGPPPIPLLHHIEAMDDPRLDFRWTDERANQWGHDLREWGIEIAKGDYRYNGKNADILGILHTNADNYYAPGFIGRVRNVIRYNPVAGVYCDCLHNYKGWLHFKTTLSANLIDLGCMVVRADIAKEVGFPWRKVNADWTFFEEIIKRYGEGSIHKINGIHFVHN
jgi:hypothetical protein